MNCSRIFFCALLFSIEMHFGNHDRHLTRKKICRFIEILLKRFESQQKLTYKRVTSSHSSLYAALFIFPSSTRSKSGYGRTLVGFSLSNPLSARTDSARWLIRFIRNEARTVGSERDFSHRYKARECNLHRSRDGTIYTAAICFSRRDLAESALLRVYETL